MEIFQIKTLNNSFRLSESEILTVNENLRVIQEYTGVVISSTRDMITSVIQEIANKLQHEIITELPVNTIALAENEHIIVIDEALQEELDKFNEIQGITSDTTLLNSINLAVITANLPAKTIEIERSLIENEIVLSLSDGHLELVDYIKDARLLKFKGDLKAIPDPENYDRQTVIHEMMFNKSTLHNWGGAYYTGL
jgi:hypothetical protein